MRVNAERVKKERQDRGWTQEQLAGAAGISLRTVQRIEAQSQASNESVSALCAVFGVPRVDLIGQFSAPAAGAGPASRWPLVLAFAAGIAVGLGVALVVAGGA